MKDTTILGKLLFGLCGLALWTIMFLAGSDVWNAAGRPDVWHRADPPFWDVRVFLYAFYGLFALLVAQVMLTLVRLVRWGSKA